MLACLNMTANTLETFSKRLAWAMQERNVGRSQLAGAIGLSPSAVTQWLDGTTKSYEAINVIKAARHLGVDADWLVTGEGSPQRASQTATQLGQLIDALPAEPAQATVDFIGYKLSHSKTIIASDQIAAYETILDHVKEEIDKRTDQKQ